MRGTEPPVNEYAPAASEQDTEAGRCFQCGSPITNVNARTTCPFCDSDNFKGQRAI